MLRARAVLSDTQPAHVQQYILCVRLTLLTADNMHRPFAPNTIRPNLPLRKPSSSPMALPLTAAPPPRFALADAAPVPVTPVQGAFGNSSLATPVIMNKSPSLLGAAPPALTVYFCNYCGQQGNFRCKRCKMTSYCSVACQAEDWKAHRHMCKPSDPEPTKEKPKETTASPVTGDKVCQPEPERIYLEDLPVTNVIKGADIQATVSEFYSPGRFFLLPQSPEVLEALQNINTELHKTFSSPSATTYIPCVGEVCAVQFSIDRSWYRGLVQTLAADQEMANILYIDFGNEEDVPVERIKPLADNIKRFCPCAMECHITSVESAGGNWSQECCTAVRQMLVGKIMTVRLVETLENGRLHAVDILLSMGKQLSTFLIEHAYAVEKTVNVVSPTEQDISARVNPSLKYFTNCSDGKDDNTWAQPPEPLIQAVGDSFFGVVTHIQSPDEINVQKVENAGVIRQLQLQLREHCTQVPAPPNFRPAPGTVCCAQFSEDKQWYRAKVLAYLSEERVCVSYLDFGNSEEVDLGHLRPISAALLSLPVQAIPCGLAGVQPVKESWSKDCLLALQRTFSSKMLRIEIQGVHEGKALVAMISETSDLLGNVAEMLTSAGFAVPAPITPVSDQQSCQTASAVEEPQVPTPACEPLKWSRAELPCDGQTVALLAGVVENPGEFYCRINNPTDNQRLMELGAELKQHCEAKAAPFLPKVGEPCCAMFPGDGAWYRAMVNEVSENKVAVNFVDHGSTTKVEMNQLRSITPKLLTLPFKAIHCSLAGVEPLGSEWSSEALLWFQTLVDGEQLSARVLSVAEQGYSVELESRGQNVAAALISEQLAKAPGGLPKETHSAAGSTAKQQDKIEEKECSQTETQARETATEGQILARTEALSFPVDWKTGELPLNEIFQPYIAAVINPSHFYLLGPSQVDQEKLQEVMMELAVYCRNTQASLSSTVLKRPSPGAACCAQFSADNNWYRAVVLEVGDNEMSVVYADFGNSEKVPFSRIMPITSHLLQLPFQITRCTLTGKDHFPAEWPEKAQQMFQNLLLNGVQATVQSFDGSANVLSFKLPTERGGGNVTSMILDALQAKSNQQTTTTEKTDQTDSSTSATPSTKAVPKPKSVSETQKGPDNRVAATTSTEPTPGINQQRTNIAAVPDKSQTSGCCCLNLTTKIDHLEKLIHSLIKQLAGQTK
ncbi:tudor domain-containing protein 1 isoform X3 [Xyrichtys novacula]|uniref:Tudor domain-containing protein 1 n=1 Tax=Xyrichtys novacula TaxID=13765 RepID=A0AAV1H5H2_XYRNO|nr:tudor domain-containing protein 1 isoform X3 [Xyrichtys novacula]